MPRPVSWPVIFQPTYYQYNAQYEEKLQLERQAQGHMFFPKFLHFFTLTFQAAHGHALGQLLLDADVQDQRGQHYHHKAGVHNTVLGGRTAGPASDSAVPPAESRDALAELIRVMEMMYSFQKERKLKRMMVIMEGCAMGKMMLVMVLP